MFSYSFSINDPLSVPSLLEQATALSGCGGYWDDPNESQCVYLNSGIAKTPKGIVVARRKCDIVSGSLTRDWRRNRSYIELSKLDTKTMCLYGKSLISRPAPNDCHSIEDPRIHTTENGFEIWCASWEVKNGKTTIQQIIVNVDEEFKVIGESILNVGGNLGEHYEKNWCPIESSDFFVYSSSPEHIVVNKKNLQHYITPGILLPGGLTMHGGTQAIEVGYEYLAFTQTSIDMQKLKVGSITTGEKYYTVWGYMFSKKSPYRITSIMNYPLLTSSFKNPFLEGSPAVIFPGGLIKSNNTEVIVTLGINDCKSGWLKIPLCVVLDRMVPFI